MVVPVGLVHSAVDGDGRKVLFDEDLVQLGGALDGADKDHALVELQGVEQIDELACLLSFLELHVVLLQSVQCQLAARTDVDFQRLLCKEGGEEGKTI